MTKGNNRRAIYLGKFVDDPLGRHQVCSESVYYHGHSHLLSIGPAGSGKGTGLIIPNLARLERSIIVVDPKGEAAAVTAAYRRRKFGADSVVVLNPFNLLVETHGYKELRSNGFNPLLHLDPDNTQTFVADAMALAGALVEIEHGQNAHFSYAARDFLCALIMAECKLAREEERRPTFSNVRRVMTQRYPEGKYIPDSAVGLVKAITEMTVMGDPVIESKVARYLEVNKETQSVMGTLIGQTSILDEPVIADDLSKGDFDFRSMKTGGVKTVYLTLPAPRLQSHHKWMRLVIIAALNALTESTPSEEGNTVLFLLDEFANLGKLEEIETGVRLVRGYGVQIWPIVQDLNQLNNIYKNGWETFFGNCEVITAYGCRDNFTQKYLSDNLGKKTEHIMGLSGGEQPGGEREGWNVGQHSEPLLHPDDFARFPRRDMLVWMYPHNPFFTHSPLYSGMGTEWAPKLKPNPYAPKVK